MQNFNVPCTNSPQDSLNCFLANFMRKLHGRLPIETRYENFLSGSFFTCHVYNGSALDAGNVNNVNSRFRKKSTFSSVCIYIQLTAKNQPLFSCLMPPEKH